MSQTNIIVFACSRLLSSIEECRKQLLVIDKICPYNSIFEMQQFASSIAMSRAAAPVITWSGDFSSVAVRGISINLEDMRQGLYQMEEKAIELLGEVSKGEHVPYFIPNNIVDDMTDNTVV